MEKEPEAVRASGPEEGAGAAGLGLGAVSHPYPCPPGLKGQSTSRGRRDPELHGGLSRGHCQLTADRPLCPSPAGRGAHPPGGATASRGRAVR